MVISGDIQKYSFSKRFENSIPALHEFISKNSEENTIEFLKKNFKCQKSDDFVAVLYTALEARYYNLFSELLDYIPEDSREALLNTDAFAQILIVHSLPLALCKKLDLCGWNPAYFNQPDRFGVTLLAKLAKSGNGDALFFRSIINRIGLENIFVTGSPNFDKTELHRCLNTRGEELLSKLKTGSKESLPLIAQHGCTITIPQENGSLLKFHGLTVARVFRYLTGHDPASQQGWDLQKSLIEDSPGERSSRSSQTSSSEKSKLFGGDASKHPQGRELERTARDLIEDPPGEKSSRSSQTSLSGRKPSGSPVLDAFNQGQELERTARDLIEDPPGEKSSRDSQTSLSGRKPSGSPVFDASKHPQEQDYTTARDLIEDPPGEKSSRDSQTSLSGRKPSGSPVFDASKHPQEQDYTTARDLIEDPPGEKSSRDSQTSLSGRKPSGSPVFDASKHPQEQDYTTALDLIEDSPREKSSQGSPTSLSGRKPSGPPVFDASKRSQEQDYMTALDLIEDSPREKSSQGSPTSLSGRKPSGFSVFDTSKHPQGQERTARDLIEHLPGEKSSQDSQTSVRGSNKASYFFETPEEQANVGDQSYPVAQAIWEQYFPQKPEETCSLRSHVWFRTHVALTHGLISIQDPKTGKFNVLGLYPEDGYSEFQKLRGVPCQILDDSNYHQYMKDYNAEITTQFLIPSEKAENIFKYVEQTKNDCKNRVKKYSLIGGNCIDFIQSVYKNANLSIVENFGEFIAPSDFKRFISLNRYLLPIQYAMLRSHGVMSTIAANLPQKGT